MSGLARVVRACAGLLLVLVVGCGAHDARPRGPAASSWPYALVPQLGHSESVHALTVSSDGRFLLSADVIGDVRVWDVKTTMLVRTITLPQDLPAVARNVWAVAISPDDSLVATATSSSVLTLWQLSSGRVVRELQGIHGLDWAPAAMTFSRDGSRIIVADASALRAFDVKTGSEVRAVAIPASDPGKRHGLMAAFSPDGRRAVTARDDERILWDVDTLTPIRTMHDVTTGPVAISADGSLIAAATHGEVAVVRVGAETNDPVAKFEGHRHATIESLAFTPDGTMLASGASNGSVRIWDVAHGNQSPLRELWGHEADVLGLRFLPSSTDLITASQDGRIEYWDASTGYRRDTVERRFEPVASLSVTPDLRLAVGGSASGRIPLWDLQRASLARLIHAPGDRVGPVAVSSDDRWVLSDLGNVSYLWNVTTGALKSLPARDSFLVDAAFTPTEGAVLLSKDGTTRLWDIPAGRFGSRTIAPSGSFEAGELSDDGQWAVLFSGDGVVTVQRADGSDSARVLSHDGPTAWCTYPPHRLLLAKEINQKLRLEVFDLDTGTRVHAVETDNQRNLGQIAAAPDGKKAAIPDENDVVLVDMASGATLRRLSGHTQYVERVAFSPDSRYVVSGGADGIRVSRVDNGASMMLATAGDEWLVLSDDGYFDASRNGDSIVAAVDTDLRPHRIDQLAPRLNRPDLILERMGLGTDAVRRHFRARHEKRLARLGLVGVDLTSSFDQAPQVSLADVARTESAGEGHAQVTVDLVARGSELARYNLYVNDVPVFGAMGKSVTGTRYHATEDVELSAGRNKVEVSAASKAGAESLRDARIVQGPAETHRNLYFLGFGVSHYANSKFDLGLADKDVQDVAATLRRMEGPAFPSVRAHTFVNAEVTQKAVTQAKSLLVDAGVNDTVVVFVAGHGVRSRDELAEYYFATYDLNPHDLPGTAVPYEQIEDLLDGIRPRQKLLLMDTCESGDTDDAAPGAGSAEAGQRGLRSRAIRSLELELEGTPGPGPQILRDVDRDRYIYGNLSRKTGAMVLASSLGWESSYEREEWGNGAFTREVLRALTTRVADLSPQDGFVSLHELRDHLGKAVADLTDGHQHPSLEQDNVDAPLRLPLADADADAARARRERTRDMATSQFRSAAPVERDWECPFPNVRGVDEALVVVKVTVTGEGDVAKVRISEQPWLKSTPVFEAAAVACAKRKKFVPALDDAGHPTSDQVEVPIHFQRAAK